MTSEFYKVLQQQYKGEVGKTIVTYISFFAMLQAENY